MYKFASFLSLIALALILPAQTVAAEGNRSILFQVGGGLYSPSYPAAFEQLMNEADAQPGVDRIKLSLNAALGVALSEKTFLMGRVDGMGDRLADSYEYMQLNLYLYSVGIRYYPATTGFYLEGGAGPSRGVTQSSAFGQVTSPSGFGFGGAVGYDFNPNPRGFGLALEAKYDSIDMEGESVGTFMLALNLCWK